MESEEGIALGSDYVRKLTQGFHGTEAASKEAVTQAIENLKKFALIGVLERLDLFARDFHRLFGVKLFLEKKNMNPVSREKQREEITEEIRKKVEEICLPDIEVYEWAVQRIVTSREDEGKHDAA